MQVAPSTEIFVINGRIGYERAIDVEKTNIVRHELSDGYIDTLNIASADIGHIFTLLSELGFEKVFEKLWIPRDDDVAFGAELFTDVFSILSNRYETLANVRNNIACYNYLIKTALTFLPPAPSTDTIVLDYGCGTGHVVDAQYSRFVTKIVGYDGCAHMRRQSRLRGLYTLSPIEYSQLNASSFTFVILNYVYPYILMSVNFREEIDRLMELIAPGGMIIGNIHKDIAIENLRIWGRSHIDSNLISYRNSPFGTIAIIRS